MIRKLLTHSSIYVAGEVLVMAGGLISFPIIARLLSPEAYGLMVIISTTILLAEALSGGGFNHASLRFYSQYRKLGKEKAFCSTLVFGSFAFGIAGTFLTFFLYKVFSAFYYVSEDIRNAFLLALPLILIRIIAHIFGSLYRIREKPGTYISFAVLNKYVGLLLIILFLGLVHLGLFGYYLGLVLGECIILMAYWLFVNRNVAYSITDVSVPILKEATAYGYPLVFYGLAGTLLASSDRYLIGHFMTKADVAIYSVPYNLCSYLSGILTSGFEFALIPIIMNEWHKGLMEKVHLELQRVMRLYCMAAFPIVAGVCVTGRQIIVLLASGKYADASFILPYIIFGVMIQGMLTPLMMGLVFSNSTRIIALMTWQVALLNILLNLFLIPKFGLQGAAVSTLLCYAVLALVGAIRSRAHFRLNLPWFPIAIYGIASLIMFVSLKTILFYFPNIELFIQIGIGFMIYISLLFVSDRKFRSMAMDQWYALRKAVKVPVK